MLKIGAFSYSCSFMIFKSLATKHSNGVHTTSVYTIIVKLNIKYIA